MATDRDPRLIGGILAALIVLGALLSFFGGGEKEPVEPPKQEKVESKERVDLNAEATIKRPNLVLINNDAFAWRDVDVSVNGAYKRRCAFIPAGQRFIIALNSLAKNDGTRFNYVTTKANNIFIYAKIPGDTASWYGTW